MRNLSKDLCIYLGICSETKYGTSCFRDCQTNGHDLSKCESLGWERLSQVSIVLSLTTAFYNITAKCSIRPSLNNLLWSSHYFSRQFIPPIGSSNNLKTLGSQNTDVLCLPKFILPSFNSNRTSDFICLCDAWNKDYIFPSPLQLFVAMWQCSGQWEENTCDVYNI